MRRRAIEVLCVLIFVAVLSRPAYANNYLHEIETEPGTEAIVTEDVSGFGAFQAECELAFERAKSAVETTAQSIKTVVVTLVTALWVVVTVLVKLVVRMVFALVLVVGQWFFAALFG